MNKKVSFFNFIFASMLALCTTFAFASCSDDDDDSTVVAQGTYSGVLGSDNVKATVTADSIEIENFPVADLVKMIVGEDAAANMGITGVNYSVAYSVKSNVLGVATLELTAAPLLVMGGAVAVDIEPSNATYTAVGNLLAFTLTVKDVTMNGQSLGLTSLPPFVFALSKE